MATNLGYSDCHLAEVIVIHDGEKMSAPMCCSFCGDTKVIVQRPPNSVEFDVELTLRRWKEGDCSTEEMLKRLATEQERIWLKLASYTRVHLEANKTPLYTQDFNTGKWEKT